MANHSVAFRNGQNAYARNKSINDSPYLAANGAKNPYSAASQLMHKEWVRGWKNAEETMSELRRRRQEN
jgi:hypothetical protein